MTIHESAKFESPPPHTEQSDRSRPDDVINDTGDREISGRDTQRRRIVDPLNLRTLLAGQGMSPQRAAQDA